MPRPSEIGNITAPDPATRRPPSGRISVSPMRRMAETEEVADLMDGHRLEIEPIRVAARPPSTTRMRS